MSLNSMYGPGAAAALSEQMDMSSVVGANAQRVTQGGGNASVTVLDSFWTPAGATEAAIIIKVAFRPNWMVWDLLWVAPGFQQLGAYNICWGLRALFNSWGVNWMVCSPGGATSEAFLLSHGFQANTFNGTQRLIARTG